MSGTDPHPQGWETIPLRYVCELNPSVDFDGLDEDDDLTFLPMDRVKSGYFIPNTDKVSKYGSSYTAFEDGDIVLAKVTPCFENGNIAIAEHLVGGKGFGSSELFVIRPTTAERRFLFYYFQSSTFKQEGQASMTGAGGLKRVSPDVLRQHQLPFPCQDVQRRIADYLDRETARIGELIAEKERMLALLEEKRAALISCVVIQAVQTLSRLNRTHPLKDDTFVLDFVNDPDEIQEAFRQYYDGSVMGEQVDPDKLYEVKAELDASGIYLQTEVAEFARVFFAPKRRQSPGDHKTMNAILDQAVARFVQLQNTEEEEAELWRGKLQAFRNLYSFLSQVIPYQDSDLEKLFTYLRHLALKLPKRKSGPGYQFDEEIELDYYRLQKISEGSISLNEGYAKPLDGPHEVGTGKRRCITL